MVPSQSGGQTGTARERERRGENEKERLDRQRRRRTASQRQRDRDTGRQGDREAEGQRGGGLGRATAEAERKGQGRAMERQAGKASTGSGLEARREEGRKGATALGLFQSPFLSLLWPDRRWAGEEEEELGRRDTKGELGSGAR